MHTPDPMLQAAVSQAQAAWAAADYAYWGVWVTVLAAAASTFVAGAALFIALRGEQRRDNARRRAHAQTVAHAVELLQTVLEAAKTQKDGGMFSLSGSADTALTQQLDAVTDTLNTLPDDLEDETILHIALNARTAAFAIRQHLDQAAGSGFSSISIAAPSKATAALRTYMPTVEGWLETLRPLWRRRRV